jgi:hypothetical protein
MESKVVYELNVRWHEGKLRVPVQLECTSLGYFSSLVMIENFIRTELVGKQERLYLGERVTFRIFEVTKYHLDMERELDGHWIYDGNGELIGGYNGPDCAPFYGRNEAQCRFKNGDTVTFLQGNKLISGKIVALPIATVTGKILLDQSDDCYLVLTGSDWENHSHPWVHYVFPEK